MKITELNGLIKIEASEGKVLTTLTPSSLRMKTLYTDKASIANYIEVNEEPKISIPHDIDTEKAEEKLGGLTLVDAYHKLLNQNRLLKEENEKLNQLINITMKATDMTYSILEPSLTNTLVEDKSENSLVDMYVAMIERELKTIEEIPTKYRNEVELILNKTNEE